MVLELDDTEVGVLRRALKARARDLRQRLCSEPANEAHQRELSIAINLLRKTDGLNRRFQFVWRAEDVEFHPRVEQS
jgi:hypothetical protein